MHLQAMSSRPRGSVWTVGRNMKGQLGLGMADGDAHAETVLNNGPSGPSWVSVSEQYPHTRLAALGSGVVQVAAGREFSAALTAGGEVHLWGSNDGGQLGNGCVRSSSNDHNCDVATPTHVAALGTDTVQLALGGAHALALKQGGAVFSWGSGYAGALGLGDTDSRLSPTEITGLGTDNAYIATQANGGMALKGDGRLFNWGSNNNNNLGHSECGTESWGGPSDCLSPVELAAVGSDNTHVVGGYAHALLLKADGSVLSWGKNNHGQIGNGECYAPYNPGSGCAASSNQVRFLLESSASALRAVHDRTLAGDADHRRPCLRRGADRGWVPQQLRHPRRRQRPGLGLECIWAAR